MKIPPEIDIPIDEWERLIENWIFVKKHRNMLKSYLIDGKTYEEIAEDFDMSSRQIARIIPKNMKILFEKAKKS